MALKAKIGPDLFCGSRFNRMLGIGMAYARARMNVLGVEEKRGANKKKPRCKQRGLDFTFQRPLGRQSDQKL